MMSIKPTLGSKITIFIPTMDRPKLLKRALKYYNLAGFSGAIIIIDSSSGNNQTETEDVCNKYKENFRHVKYKYLDRSTTLGEIHALAGKGVNTPYFAYSPDDDVHSTLFLEYAQSFLDSQDKYKAIRGHRVSFVVGSTPPLGITEVGLDHYPQTDSNTALTRMENYVRAALSPQYSIFQTSVWNHAQSYNTSPYIPYFSEEFFPCLFLVGLGPIYTSNRLGVMKQQDAAGSLFKRNLWLDIITHEDWPVHIKKMLFATADILKNVDQLDQENAEREAKRLLWTHLSILTPYHLNVWLNKQEHPGPINSNPNLLTQLRTQADFRIFEQILSEDI